MTLLPDQRQGGFFWFEQGEPEECKRGRYCDASGPDAVILDQVTNGVAVRMAVLYLLIGGR